MHPGSTSLVAFSLLANCAALTGCAQDSDCAGVPPSFARQVSLVLSDTTGRFFHDYPTPTPLTCELLRMLQEEMKDDSVRYHFEHMHQRSGDPRASAAFTYIKRHNHFHLAMALTAHWNPDTRIEAVRAVNNYRRIRPMVCTTQAHYARLEEQDRAAVRYFIRVMETTPWGISGSENSTIHAIYMRTVMETLELFTAQDPRKGPDSMISVPLTGKELERSMQRWRKWLDG